MPVFSERHFDYKMGVFTLIVAAAMASWGVVAPGWLESESAYKDLWFECEKGYHECEVLDLKHTPDGWFYAVLAFCSVGLLAVLCACVLLLYKNCCVSSVSYSYAPQVLAFIAGVTLFIGSMLYLGKRKDRMHDVENDELGASFIVTVMASAGCFIAGLLIFCYEKRANSVTLIDLNNSSHNTTSGTATRRDGYQTGYQQGYDGAGRDGYTNYGSTAADTSFQTAQPQQQKDMK